MENNLVETQKQVFCAPGTDSPLCVDSHGVQVPVPTDASVPPEQVLDAETVDDALELEADTSGQAEVPMFDGTTTVTMMFLGLLAFGAVTVFFKKVL